MNSKNTGPLVLLIAFFTLVFAPSMVLSGRLVNATANESNAANTTSGPLTSGDGKAATRSQQLSKDNNNSAPTQAQPAKADDSLTLKGKTIVIDAGHGGTDAGAMRREPAPKGQRGAFVMEKDVNLAVARRLADKLRARGATVILTRSTDVFVSLPDRVTMSNGIQPDLFLSVHSNAATDRNVDGIETYYYSSASECPADRIQHALVSGLSETSNWVRQRELYVTHHATVPAVLAEIGYLSHPSKLMLLKTPAYQDRVASSLARGVEDYFGSPCPQSITLDAQKADSTASAPEHDQSVLKLKEDN